MDDAQDLRCRAKKHGEIGPGWIEFRCNSVFCGSGPGVVVIHRFYLDKLDEEPETKMYKDPWRKNELSPGNSSAVRDS